MLTSHRPEPWPLKSGHLIYFLFFKIKVGIKLTIKVPPMFLCITIFFQDKFAKVIGWLTWLRFCETCADLEWQPVWRSGYLILPLLHCTTNTIRCKCFHWCLTNTTKLVSFCSSALSSKYPRIFILHLQKFCHMYSAW